MAEPMCGDRGPGSDFGYPPLAPCVLPVDHGGAHSDGARRQGDRWVAAGPTFRDDRPETIGSPFHHEDARECYLRPDGSWWPWRYEDGVLNGSATTLCFRSHMRYSPGAGAVSEEPVV